MCCCVQEIEERYPRNHRGEIEDNLQNLDKKAGSHSGLQPKQTSTLCRVGEWHSNLLVPKGTRMTFV
jgi:hypothetical protein